MKLIFKVLPLGVCLAACSNSKTNHNDVLVYNEKLTHIVSVIDSTRGLIGDREDEPRQELEADLNTYRSTISEALKDVETLTFKKDTAFKNEVIRYVLLNKGLSEVDFPNLIKLKTKLENDSTANKPEIYGLMGAISESIDKNLDLYNARLGAAQVKFAKSNKLSLK